MSAEPYIIATVPRTLIDVGTTLGVPREHLLACIGLSEAELAEPDRRVPFGDHMAATARILGTVPPARFVLEVGKRFNTASIGSIGYTLRHCPTLEAALTTFCRFQHFISNQVLWTFNPASGTLTATTAVPQIGVQAMLLLIVQIGRQLTKVHWVPQQVLLAHASETPNAELNHFVGTPLQFAAGRNCIVFPQSVLALPIHGGKSELIPLLVEHLDEQSPVLAPIQRQLRQALTESLSVGMTDRVAYARILGMSERTLNRRLKAVNTTFRKELETTRFALCETWLSEGRLAIYEMAFLLGYSEPSTLHRAFRNRYGCTPGVWQEQARTGSR